MLRAFQDLRSGSAGLLDLPAMVLGHARCGRPGRRTFRPAARADRCGHQPDAGMSRPCLDLGSMHSNPPAISRRTPEKKPGTCPRLCVALSQRRTKLSHHLARAACRTGRSGRSRMHRKTPEQSHRGASAGGLFGIAYEPHAGCFYDGDDLCFSSCAAFQPCWPCASKAPTSPPSRSIRLLAYCASMPSPRGRATCSRRSSGSYLIKSASSNSRPMRWTNQRVAGNARADRGDLVRSVVDEQREMLRISGPTDALAAPDTALPRRRRAWRRCACRHARRFDPQAESLIKVGAAAQANADAHGLLAALADALGHLDVTGDGLPSATAVHSLRRSIDAASVGSASSRKRASMRCSQSGRRADWPQEQLRASHAVRVEGAPR